MIHNWKITDAQNIHLTVLVVKEEIRQYLKKLDPIDGKGEAKQVVGDPMFLQEVPATNQDAK